MGFYDIPASKLAWMMKQLMDPIETASRLYKEVEYCCKGPYGKGIIISKEMNAQAKHIHIVGEDHSLRVYVYATPDDDHEQYLPAFMRTYIFTNPAYFMVAGESERADGGLKKYPWEKEMLKAEIPEAFIEMIRPKIQHAIDNYGDSRKYNK